MQLNEYTNPSQIKSLTHKVRASPDKFSFFQPAVQEHWQFFAIEEKGRVLGLLGFQESQDAITLQFCEVGVSQRLKGIAKKLMQEIVGRASWRNKTMEVTPYEEDGLKGMKPVMQQLCRERGVPLVEQGYASDLANDPDMW